jgi:predicted nuclease of predicted toxin-antitoxin system
VTAIAEVSMGMADEEVMRRALREGRELVTEDQDFGELVYNRGHSSCGVVRVKFPSRDCTLKSTSTVEAIATVGARLMEGFTVIEPGRARIARLP